MKPAPPVTTMVEESDMRVNCQGKLPPESAKETGKNQEDKKDLDSGGRWHEIPANKLGVSIKKCPGDDEERPLQDQPVMK